LVFCLRQGHGDFHLGDLLLLRRNDVLGEAAQFRVRAMRKLHPRHVDGTLVMRNHT
jgi:hypothetical protein